MQTGYFSVNIPSTALVREAGFLRYRLGQIVDQSGLFISFFKCGRSGANDRVLFAELFARFATAKKSGGLSLVVLSPRLQTTIV